MATLRHPVTVLVFALTAGFLTTSQANPAAESTASPQILFSAISEPSSFSCENANCAGPAHFGFWIRCTAPSSTSNGDCSGSMFFYNMKPIAVPVTGAVTLTGMTATVTVSSPATAPTAVYCMLVNNSSLTGRHNTVTVSCDRASWTKPGPSGVSTTNADAIVQIPNRRNEAPRPFHSQSERPVRNRY